MSRTPAKSGWPRAVARERYENEDGAARIVFRIRRQYLDQVVAGTKAVEYRRDSDHWRAAAARVLEAFARKRPVIAVFVCGTDVRRYRLWGLSLHDNAFHALGREPSAQGWRDLGTGAVIGFHLGGPVD